MADSPLVTIGLPAYNRERYLRLSLDSLLSQTYRNFELIISDNASTDSTGDICREYADADPRIRYYRNARNVGNPGNFNRIVELTRTPFLKWSTTDDLWEPTFLEKAMEVILRDESIALCYPKTMVIDSEGANATPYEDKLHLMQDDPADRFLTLLQNIGLAHQHLGVIRMSCLRRTRLLAPHVASDLNLLAELSLYGKFYELPERLFSRRFHPTSGSWSAGDAHQLQFYLAAGARQGRLTSRWPLHRAYFRAVRRSPLPARSKLRLYGNLARRVNWERRTLLKEFLGRMHGWGTVATK